MCLISRRKNAYIAHEVIKVYKVLIVRNNILTTPFYRVDIPEIPYILFPEDSSAKPKGFYGIYKIGAGFIHAYTGIDFEFSYEEKCDLAIAECHIPIGSRYYTDQCKRQICANKLVIDRIIPRNEFDKIYHMSDYISDDFINKISKSIEKELEYKLEE